MHFSLVYAATAAFLALRLPLVNAQGFLPSGTYRLESLGFGSLTPPRVLDLFNSSAIPGTRLVSFPNHNGNNQRWNVVQTGPGYNIAAVAPPSSASVLTFNAGSIVTGTPFAGTTFLFNRVNTNNIYQILAVSPNGAFGMQSTTEDGPIILALVDATDPRQSWRLVRL